jgi:anti-anti-sigma regulatory factor
MPYRVQEIGKHRMLKIRRSANGEVVFTLSGRMDHESTAELENLIGAETKNQRIVLNLKDLTLVGQSDIEFLARCEATGIRLVDCARYVRDWIARQQSVR